MTFKPGDDVIVTFDGNDVPGEVISAARGYVLARVIIDPDWDYGSLSGRLDAISTVMVKEKWVQHQ